MSAHVDGAPSTARSIEFLHLLHPEGPWHLCSIVPDGKITSKTFSADQVHRMHEFIEGRQGRENIYVHVNTLHDGIANSKAKKSDVVSARFAHIDIDDLGGLERLRSFSPPPTAIAFSGGGYNAYWRFSEPIADLESVENINRWLVQELSGDSAATDVSRILRVPGTVNIPTKKKAERGRTHSVAALVAQYSDWSRTYAVDTFGSIEPVRSSTRVQSANQEHVDHPPQAAELPASAPEWLKVLAKHGDDVQRPRNGNDPRYRSRSEAVWALSCALARFGTSAETIAGVLVNPNYRISESVLEKSNPRAIALRQSQRAIDAVGSAWPNGVKDSTNIPRRAFQNTQAALLRLGVEFWFDEFRQRMFVGGIPLQSYLGELNDRAALQLRDMVDKKFGFDPGKELTRDAIEQLCSQNPIDPVREYLDNLEWNGVPRLDTWLIEYASAEDTEYVRAVSRIVLIAAVRRARQPGIKFDTILVLEGPQGSGKSTLIRIMASDEFFSDQDILALDTKAQMEALEGIWLFELCELAGMKHTDVNKIKAFASRAVDRARPAYGRFSESRPRRGILIGTTNDDEYLKDETGNRRFWPVRTGTIDLSALKAVRDQLWAEAAKLERTGAEIVLPQDLWSAAQVEQDKRVEADGWEGILNDINGFYFGGRELFASSILVEQVLRIPAGQIQRYHFKRLAKAMRALGWNGPETLTFPNGWKAKGYWRPTDESDSPLSNLGP